MALKNGWQQEPGNPVEDIKSEFAALNPKFESGDRAWLILSTNLGWVVFVGPCAGPVLVVQNGAGGEYFWCYLGAGNAVLEDGAIKDLGPSFSRLEAKNLFRTREEAESEARRRNAVRDGGE